MDIPIELKNEVGDFLAVLNNVQNEEESYGVIETRLDFLKLMTQNIEAQLHGDDGLVQCFTQTDLS